MRAEEFEPKQLPSRSPAPSRLPMFPRPHSFASIPLLFPGPSPRLLLSGKRLTARPIFLRLERPAPDRTRHGLRALIRSTRAEAVLSFRIMAATTTPPSAAPAPALSKGQVFVRRLTSTAILWTIVLTAMFSGNELVSNGVFLLLMLVLTCVGLTEF